LRSKAVDDSAVLGVNIAHPPREFGDLFAGPFQVDPFAAAGCFPMQTPGRRSTTGRIGRGANPPQFGQTLNSTSSTHSAQNVHS